MNAPSVGAMIANSSLSKSRSGGVIAGKSVLIPSDSSVAKKRRSRVLRYFLGLLSRWPKRLHH